MSNLHDHLGGKLLVETAVDLFYEKVLADDRVRHVFDHADRVTARGRQKVFLAYAFSGRVESDGRALRETHHAHPALTDAQQQAVAEHLEATLRELDVEPTFLNEVMTFAAAVHADRGESSAPRKAA